MTTRRLQTTATGREPAMASELDIGLYGQSLFNDDNNATNISNLGELVGSGFTTLMLFSLHVDPYANLSWGNNPIASSGRIVYPYKKSQNPPLPEILRQLRVGGFNTILFSV